MQRALVIGVNGQDGSYLAEHLLLRGDEVAGVGRQQSSKYVGAHDRYRYHAVDISQPGALRRLLHEAAPQRIYHTAAIHGAAGFVYEDKWQAALAVNVGSVHECLEYIRLKAPSARLMYSSSLKAFGANPPEIVSEKSPRVSTCLYSITKNAATDLIDYYRIRHDVRATVLYLFNHESPRRPEHFVLPRIVELLAAAMAGKKPAGNLRSLEFSCDWGSSAEYMALGTDLLDDARNEDYVMATGKTWTGEEFVSALFRRAGLDWTGFITLSEESRQAPAAIFRADITRMIKVLGHGPRLTAIDVAGWILRENHGLQIDKERLLG